LEYAAYQSLLREQLAQHRFQEVARDTPPQAFVSFSFFVDGGEERLHCIPLEDLDTMPVPIADRPYGLPRGPGDEPSPGYTPICDPAQVPQTNYMRDLILYIVDSSSLDQSRLRVLYEGTVRSRGPSSQLPQVMPAMVKALFRDFPGESGTTRIERIQIDAKPEAASVSSGVPRERL
jgi:hypothetical protein